MLLKPSENGVSEIVAILNFKQRMTEVADLGQGSKKSRKSRTPVPLFRRESNPNASGKMHEKLGKTNCRIANYKISHPNAIKLHDFLLSSLQS